VHFITSSANYSPRITVKRVDCALIMNEVALLKCKWQWSVHAIADSGQLHFTIDQTGRRAPLWSCVWRRIPVTCLRPGFRPGRAAFKANGPGRAGPGQVLDQTTYIVYSCNVQLSYYRVCPITTKTAKDNWRRLKTTNLVIKRTKMNIETIKPNEK